MNIISEIESVVEKLNEIQIYTDNLNTQLSLLDCRRCDLEHSIENNPVTPKGSYRLVKELKEIMTERRKVKNDMEIARVLSINFNKILSNTNREFLVHELKKANGKLNTEYKNRIYGQGDIEYFVGRSDSRELQVDTKGIEEDKTSMVGGELDTYLPYDNLDN